MSPGSNVSVQPEGRDMSFRPFCLVHEATPINTQIHIVILFYPVEPNTILKYAFYNVLFRSEQCTNQHLVRLSMNWCFGFRASAIAPKGNECQLQLRLHTALNQRSIAYDLRLLAYTTINPSEAVNRITNSTFFPFKPSTLLQFRLCMLWWLFSPIL